MLWPNGYNALSRLRINKTSGPGSSPGRGHLLFTLYTCNYDISSTNSNLTSTATDSKLVFETLCLFLTFWSTTHKFYQLQVKIQVKIPTHTSFGVVPQSPRESETKPPETWTCSKVVPWKMHLSTEKKISYFQYSYNGIQVWNFTNGLEVWLFEKFRAFIV